MARYEKVFTLTPKLYVKGSPVIIEAGALQKDNFNGNVIAQLKFKSISAKVIKALTVKIVALDVSGNPIGEEIEHQYLDLTVQRNENFGSKEAIILPDNTAREFWAYVTDIVFFDNTLISLKKSYWNPLPLQEDLNIETDDDIERIFFSQKFRKQIIDYKDLWLCSCEGINHIGEKKCFTCGNLYDVMGNFDFEFLHNEAYYCYAKSLSNSENTDDVEYSNEILEQIIDYKDSKSIYDKNIIRIKYLKSDNKSKNKQNALKNIGIMFAAILSGLGVMVISSLLMRIF
ncbi:hypothetical protein [Eubacterium sp.]